MGDGLSRIDPKVGRSRRMLYDALEKVREGKTVHVLALYNEGVTKLQKIAENIGALPTEVHKLNIIKYRAIWDIECLLGHNGAQGVVYFVDHEVIEDQYRNALAMLRRYDAN